MADQTASTIDAGIGESVKKTGVKKKQGAGTERNAQIKPDYEVGYKRPPKHTQYKPGQHGNPRGRPRGSQNKKTLVERALGRRISVQRGDKTSQTSVFEAMAENFAFKAAQGDRHAAGVVISLATKTGVFEARNDDTQSTSGQRAAIARTTPSDALVESVNPARLSRDEQFDLSRIAEIIDLGGDVTALSGDDFARLKEIVNKGRGEDVTPIPDEALKEAA